MSAPEKETQSREPSVEALVLGAQGGSRAAFDRLVVRFQDMAIATAYGWLRDPQLAQDAAQEAFVEAYRNLDRLQTPAAFPGFLRRIVLKHCDRRTRRRTADLVPLQEAGESPASEPIADASLTAARERARVRAAVEELPDTQRLLVSLHYLAGLSQAEVADWLELPLSTVKKRLHTARRKLRTVLEDRMKESLQDLRASRNSQFSNTIRFFLGIREGDLAGVRELLDQAPDLLGAEERWEEEVTRVHALPVPNGGTPLVRAAERNQVEIIDLLLERGAEVDRACSCAGGETPLWAAVASGQVEAARRLLERGANPDSSSFAGHTPLHVAALRGFEDLVDLLCQHGADGTLLDRRGRTPLRWAQEKSYTSIAARLSERFPPAQAGGAQALPIAPWETPTTLETGIKAIDLFAPIAPGSLVQMRYGPGQGAVVLLGELSARWILRNASESCGKCPAVIWVGWERNAVDRGEMEHVFAECDLARGARMVWSPASEYEESRRGTVLRAFEEAEALHANGVSHPLVVVFAQRGRMADVEVALPQLASKPTTLATAPITLIVAERDGEPAADMGRIPPPFDVRIGFDSALAAIRHYPAIHPLTSDSHQLCIEGVGEAHCRVAADARALLARFRRLVPDLSEGLASEMSEEDREAVQRARSLQAFLTQPFLVAEPFTGAHGHASPMDVTLEKVAAIVAGTFDEDPWANWAG